MNRRKHTNKIIRARNKKASAKLAPRSKSKYISKAERAKLAAQEDAPSEEFVSTSEG